MDQAIIQVGLPVKCAYGDCKATGFVKPASDYGGWYKSRLFRFRISKRWFCPKHAQKGKDIDKKFYEMTKTPAPAAEPAKETVEDLYALLDLGEDDDSKPIKPVS